MNSNISETVNLTHCEEWHDLYTEVKLIIYTKSLN